MEGAASSVGGAASSVEGVGRDGGEGATVIQVTRLVAFHSPIGCISSTVFKCSKSQHRISPSELTDISKFFSFLHLI